MRWKKIARGVVTRSMQPLLYGEVVKHEDLTGHLLERLHGYHIDAALLALPPQALAAPCCLHWRDVRRRDWSLPLSSGHCIQLTPAGASG